MGIKKNCAIPAKNWRNMRFSGQKNAHLWKQRLFAVPVRFTVMQKKAGTDSCSHALCRTADDIFSPGTCIKAHTDDHKRKEKKKNVS